jgi:sortase A
VISLFEQRKTNRILLLAEIVFMLAGFVCLGWAGYATAQRLLYSSWQDYKFEQSLQGERTTLAGYLKFLREGDKATPHAEDEEPTAELVPAPPRPPKARKLTYNELIGRIEIPRVNVSAVVKEGVDTQTLSRAAGHVPATALPGEKGNVGVAAHRDTFFRGLRNVRQGDVIRVVTLDGTYLYKVDAMKIVWPKNVEVLDPTPDPQLTLVTCYPFNYIGSAPKRFIVQAKQVGFEEIASRDKSRNLPTVSGRSKKAGT